MVADRLLGAQHTIAEHTFFHAALREFLALGLTISIAAISYVVLERPFLKLKQKFTHIRSRPV
jgi:peptidoglycan/LPS O-acetylase OafA/YrhL